LQSDLTKSFSGQLPLLQQQEKIEKKKKNNNTELACSQIWLNYFLNDCHLGHIKKSLKLFLKKRNTEMMMMFLLMITLIEMSMNDTTPFKYIS
jgi:hypothetical protein